MEFPVTQISEDSREEFICLESLQEIYLSVLIVRIIIPTATNYYYITRTNLKLEYYLPRPVMVAKAVDLASCLAGAFIIIEKYD